MGRHLEPWGWKRIAASPFAAHALVSFGIMLALAIVLSGFFRQELQEHVQLLAEHERAMVRGPVDPDAPHSVAGIEAHAIRLQQRTYVLLGGGFLVLYGSLLLIERRRNRSALRGQREFYEHVLDNIPVAIAVFDAEHRFKFCNPAAIRDADTRAWVIGKDDFDYCAHRGFDTAVAEARWALFEAAVEDHAAKSYVETLVNRHGQVEHHLRHMSPVFVPDGDLEIMLA